MATKHSTYGYLKGKFDPFKHPRGAHGHWAHTAGAPSTPKLSGKTAPASFKFYKPGYKPKGFANIKGVNAKSNGKLLWLAKKNGEVANDYEFWLLAQKLAAEYKKKHPKGDAASPNAIVNAAFQHELDETGDVKLGGNGHPTGGLNTPEAPTTFTTPSKPKGIKLTTKHAPPGTLTTFVKKMPGATGAEVWKDDKGQEWLVKGLKQGKSNAYSNKGFAVELEEALAKIQNKAGLRSATSHKTTLNGKHVLAQKMFGDVHEAFPKTKPDIMTMTDEQKLEMQKQQIFDWVISNFDTHTGNFLEDDKGIIGIDKGQAFKFFGKDKLSSTFVPVTPLGGDQLTYSVMWQQYESGKGDMLDFTNSPELSAFVERLQNIPDDEYKSLLKPYAEEAYNDGILAGGLNPDQFLEKAVARKNNAKSDFEKFYAHSTNLHLDNLDIQDKAANALPADHPAQSVTPTPKTAGSVTPQDFEVGDDVHVLWPSGIPKDGKITQAGNKSIKMQSTTGGAFTLHYQDGTWESNSGASIEVSKPGGAKTTEGFAKPENLLAMWHNGEIDYEELKADVAAEMISESDIINWKVNGDVNMTQYMDLMKSVPKEKNNVTPSIPQGYSVEEHPAMSGKFAIKKPNGDFAKASDSTTVKSWDTKEEAIASSTMKKYATQHQQQAQAGLSGAVADAKGATNYKLADLPGISQAELDEFNSLKDKIAAGEHSPEDYLQFKTLKQKFNGAKKAQGAAQVEQWDDGTATFEPPTPAQTAIKKGKLPTPKWKKVGGSPAPLSKATGPNALDDGAKLWDMKKAGQFNSDEDLWKAAQKLSALYKKKAQADDPGKLLVSGVDYSSPNQLRNVAQRLEFDETGDVTWSSKAEKTSEQVGETVTGIKKQNALHHHVPTKSKSDAHSTQGIAFESAIDSAQPVGSYQHPHSFAPGSTGALRAYGQSQMTDHNVPWDSNQKQAWYNFSGSWSGGMNTFFRTGETGLGFSNVEEVKKRCKALVDAFKSPNVKGTQDWTIVTRGTNGGWEFGIGKDAASFDEIKAMEGKVVRNKCPVSSSLRTRPAFGGQTRITYKLPPGFKGIALLGKSAHPGEDEVMLPPGMAYRILEVKKGNGSYQNEVLVEVVDVKLPEVQ